MATRESEEAASVSQFSSNKWKYDVFLSFKGKDTRKNFTDHLYAALHRKGIIAFKDDQTLERGNTISTQIIEAIKDSRFLVVIFSRNYASSAWCLDELVHISECLTGESETQTVLPIFYGVHPSEVRNQTGRFGKALAQHEEAFRQNYLEKEQKWRTSLTKVANLSGWDSQNRCESEFVQDIVEELSRKLSLRFSGTVSKDLVGIDSNVDDISSYIGREIDDVRVVGICGMGGIGKTTIARVVYERLCDQFEGSSFLANVSEIHEKYGAEHLQEQLLSEILLERNMRVWNAYGGANEISYRMRRKKVLVVLDDVDQLEQLGSLADTREWFGRGSRIIITTRDKGLLISHGVDKIYKIEGLNRGEALRLFSLKAFRNDCPEKDYVELSNHVVDYANGLPLALAVLGSFLFRRSVSEWKSALSKLKEIPNKKILDKLRISFDGLDAMEKKIFLDIACFFKGKSYDYVTKILECCGFHPEIGMRVLLDRSLITISENRLWMHDLLQQMGQEIVRPTPLELEPGKLSRLWLYKDFYHVFMQNTGTEEVEGIVLLDSVKREGEHLNPEAFVKMKRLRLLKLQNLQFHLASGLEYLSNELQYLEWHGYPFKSLPSSFRANKLVELNLRCSQIEQLWIGKRIKLLENLRFISLSHSRNLMKTPDFEGLPNVEVLNLEGCTRLFAVHQSIGVLKRLVLLNLKDCKNLKTLPSSICNLMSLKILILSGCSKLEKLPEKLGCIACLEELHLGRTAIRQLPFSVVVSKSLQVLSFQGHRGVLKRKSRALHFPFHLLPRKNTSAMALMFPSLLAVRHLKNLDLSDCKLKEGMIPDALSCFVTLETLILTGNDFVSIPASIRALSKLEVLYVDKCKRLELLPELPQGIKYVNMNDCTSLVSLPNPLEVNHSSDGFEYTFTNCTKLIERQGSSGMGFSWLRRCLHLLLQKLPQGFFDFDMCLPASETPAWFNYQAVGSSATIPLHPHWCNTNWKGFAVSALFAVDENVMDEDVHCNNDGDSEILRLQCFLQPNIEKFRRLLPSTLTLPRDTRPGLDRHWLIYVSGCLYLGGVDWWNKCSQIEVTFGSKGVEVKRCGIRLVYEEDVEALDPNKNSGNRGLENLGVQSCENYNIGDAVKGNKSGSLYGYGEVLHSKRLRVLAS